MGVHEVLGWFALAVLKFAITPSIMIGSGYKLLETWILVAVSACIGVTVFYYFGSFIFTWVNSKRKKKKKIFSKQSRRTVKFVRRYGLWGLALMSLVLSVPIAGVLAAKFFHKPRIVLPVLYIAFSSWALILTSLSYLLARSING